jgi:hypothetical protein
MQKMSSNTGRKMERYIMIRIGFDPILEAEQQHLERLKIAAYERMLREARDASHTRSAASSRLLALLGKELAFLGLRLAGRYGDGSEAYLESISQSNLKDCR